MAGKTPIEAVKKFLQPLQRVLSCITRGILLVSEGGYRVAPHPHSVLVGTGLPVRLKGSLDPSLRFLHTYRIVEDGGPRGPWKVQSGGYCYALENQQAEELVAYHWHPSWPSTITFPHLHIGAGAATFRHDLDLRLPTRRISIESFVRLALTQFRVECLDPDRDWSTLLDDTESAFNEWNTWT